MSPHETLFLESTHNVDIHLIANNAFVKFQTWDFGGDMNLEHGVRYQNKVISPEAILKGCSTLVYVIDAQEDDYEDSLPKLVETIVTAHKINPLIHFEVFLHKIDGDSMAEELRAERQQGIQNYVSAELSEINGDVLVSYYLTSIYDHSALEAFSKVTTFYIMTRYASTFRLDIYYYALLILISWFYDSFLIVGGAKVGGSTSHPQQSAGQAYRKVNSTHIELSFFYHV